MGEIEFFVRVKWVGYREIESFIRVGGVFGVLSLVWVLRTGRFCFVVK